MEAIRLRRTLSGWLGRLPIQPGINTTICTPSKAGCAYGGSHLTFGHRLRATHFPIQWLSPFCQSHSAYCVGLARLRIPLGSRVSRSQLLKSGDVTTLRLPFAFYRVNE